jgi:ribosomal-protein-alanine N-acetyltransferase
MHIDPIGSGRLARCPRCKRFIIVPTACGDLARQPEFRLSTRRLGLELATRKYWREIHAIHSDARNYEYEISSPMSERETKAQIKRLRFPSGFAKSNQLLFRMSALSDGRTVGTLTVAFTLPYYCAYVGFMINKEDQGKGYGTEGLSAVCRLLHGDLSVERITAMCDANNRPCRALLEKVGFKQEGVFERFFHHPDRGWLDSPTYAFLRGSNVT